MTQTLKVFLVWRKIDAQGRQEGNRGKRRRWRKAVMHTLSLSCFPTPCVQETLLNALMLLSTFLLAFSAGTLIEYSYADFLDIDARAISAAVKGDNENVNLTGSVVLRGFLLATTLLMISLSMGTPGPVQMEPWTGLVCLGGKRRRGGIGM